MPVADELIESTVNKFLWNGTDKATRLSTINDYRDAKGGLKTIDLEIFAFGLVTKDF